MPLAQKDKSVEQSLKTRPSIYYMLVHDKIDISI